MPYRTNDDLPDSVKVLPPEAQTLWRKVYNNTNAPDEEERFRIAWGAVKKWWTKNQKGEWIKVKTVDIKNVELAAVGKWPASEGDGEITKELLEECVETEKKLRGDFNPPIKLGHDDLQKFWPQKDGAPALGWVANLRMKGKKLLGDLKAVPAFIADLIKKGAYRSRSVEIGYIDAKGTGKEEDKLLGLRGVSLIGMDLPAVKGLKDIAKLYGAGEEESVVYAFSASEEEVVTIELTAEEDEPSIDSILDEIDSFMERTNLAAKGKPGVVAVRTFLKDVKSKLLSMRRTKLKEWDTKYINDLPDAAFALIRSGGEKDDEGKTTPRNLRMLPHHNASVKSPSENESVDLPHLRNALARLDQTNMSADEKARARAHLIAHARALKVGNYSEEGGEDMDEKAVRELFGLSEEADIVAELANFKEVTETKISELQNEISRLKTSKLSEGEKIAKEYEVKLQEQRSRIDELERRLRKERCEKVIKAAMDAGKITPAMKDAWVKHFMEDEERTIALMKTLQPVVKLTEVGSACNEGGAKTAEQEVKEKIAAKRAADKSLTFKDALMAVLSEDPDLAKRYRASA